MRRLLVLLAAIACALAATSVVLAAEFGANDDTALHQADGGDAFYARMAELGLRQSVIGVRWSPADPLAVPRAAELARTVPIAEKHGIAIVFAVFPYPPREIESGKGGPEAFAAWVELLAKRFPTVRQYVVGNEPNQPAFWRPQFDRDGRNRSAAAFGPYLAAAYDALKTVDPALTVIGVGLSPRGNDKPRARSNVSTSPVRFLAALGRWYRASGRDRPLMDGFSFHPYPNRATDGIDVGYAWPNAGFANLARVKQALWDAFAGTPQPTTVDGLRLYLDEVGWQVDTSFLGGYVGVENVPVTDEFTQADVYVALVRRASCDPDVATVNLFGFYDDPNRRGFQAALFRADGTPRPAAERVQAALRDTTACSAPPWAPVTGVVGARPPRIDAGTTRIRVWPVAAEGLRVTVCAYPPHVAPTAAVRLTTAASTGAAAACASRRVTQPRGGVVVLPRPATAARGGTLGVRLVSETNPTRRTVFAARFR